MTKASSIAALIGVWTAGMMAAAAAYTVHKPLVVPPPVDLRVSVAEVKAPLAQEPAAIEEEEVMMMPADTIVASVRPVAPPLVRAVRAELPCKGWVNLSQGPAGAQVRYCE